MTTTALTDRYVWAVTRTQPESARADLGAELRERIADQIDARLENGVAADVVERVVLTELGDPDRLAATYADRPLHLIGPRHYLTWLRLLKLLLTIVVPIVAAALALAFTIEGGGLGEIVTRTVGVTVTVAIHVCFWTTLAFALIERYSQSGVAVDEWAPDQLPELPAAPDGRSRRGETIGWLACLAVFAVALVAQQFNPFSPDGSSIPVLDPGLWSFWIPYLLVLIVVEAATVIALYRRGGWTWGFAVGNLLLNLAFAVPVIWLIASGQFVNPDLLEAIGLGTEPEVRRIVAIVASFGIGAVAAWDSVSGFLELRRERRRGPLRVAAAP